MAVPTPATPSSKAEPTTAITTPADVQVVTGTISDDHTLSVKPSNRPMPLDQTHPLKPAVRQRASSSSSNLNKHLSPTSGSSDSTSRPKQKRVAFAEENHEADEREEAGEGTATDIPPEATDTRSSSDDDFELDEALEAGPSSPSDDLEDTTFQLEEDMADGVQGVHGKDDDFQPPTLEEAARMLSEDVSRPNASSAQAIGIGGSSLRASSRDAESASALSSSMRIAGSFSQFMRQQATDETSQWDGPRLAELKADYHHEDPAVPPSPPSAGESIGRPIYEGASQTAVPLSTSQFGSYTAWNLRSTAQDQIEALPSRPARMRRPSASTEQGLNQIIGAIVPSHRHMWQATRKSTKYALSDEDNKRWAAWQRRRSQEGSESSSATGGTADLSRSVPAGPAPSQAIRRGGLHTPADPSQPPSDVPGAVNIPSRQPSFQSRADEIDREAKTSLPYNEKLLVPSYMKAIGNLSTARLGRGSINHLATIQDDDNAVSSPDVPIAIGFDPLTHSKPVDAGPHCAGADASSGQTALASSTGKQRVPFLAPQDSERRQKLLASPYQAPPGPTSSGDRLKETEEDAPQPLPLFEVPPLPSNTTLPSGTTGSSSKSHDFVDADNQAGGVLKFMHRIGMLKTNKRTGWYHHRVERPESIADHMYRMGVLAMLCASDDSGLDVGKCVMLALIHDMAEAEVGDLTPRDNVNKQEKTRREAEAIEYLTFDLLGGSRAGQRIEALWREYEDRSSPEALLVKDLDRFELCLQAVEYEREYNIKDLQPFFRGAIGQISHPIVRRWAIELAAERQAMWAERGHPYEQTHDDARPDIPPATTPATQSGAGQP